MSPLINGDLKTQLYEPIEDKTNLSIILVFLNLSISAPIISPSTQENPVNEISISFPKGKELSAFFSVGMWTVGYFTWFFNPPRSVLLISVLKKAILSFLLILFIWPTRCNEFEAIAVPGSRITGRSLKL